MNNTRLIILAAAMIASSLSSSAFAQDRMAVPPQGSAGASSQIQSQERKEYRAPGNTQDIAPSSKETATGGQAGGLPNKN